MKRWKLPQTPQNEGEGDVAVKRKSDLDGFLGVIWWFGEGEGGGSDLRNTRVYFCLKRAFLRV